jgi:8-oxo-dGTP diphosphatase
MQSKDFTPDIFHLSIPVVAMDIVIFTVYRDTLCVVLMPGLRENSVGKLVLPGGIIAHGESLDTSFDRILEAKTGITGIYKEQLATFGDADRDTRGHVISVVYYALVDTNMFLDKIDMTKTILLPLSEVTTETIAYDHAKIILYARQRLEWKMGYTTIIKNILPECFTLSQLQHVYEVVFGKTFDKRNFRKKILALGIIEETGIKNKSSSKRPAELYRFSDKDVKMLAGIV